MVVSRGAEAMEQVLCWDGTRTSTLLQACEAELNKRLQQVQAVQSIRSATQTSGSQQSSGTTEEAVEAPGLDGN